MMKKTKRLALSAILAALSVVILYLFTLLGIFDLCGLLLSSLLVLFCMMSAEGIYPYLMYGVVSLLSLLLLPDKSIAVLYILLGGPYPLLKFRLDKLPKVPGYLLKFLWLNGVAVLTFLLARFVFLSAEAEINPLWEVLFLLAANFCFLLYDVLLRRCVRYYFIKIQPRIQRLLK